ncbi:hypothetical protein Bca52824_063775 [Brassica carinata]|uniref:Glycosyltransferase n=1 Tax=Brassica carinata TaxID=52824 RepID=A0A8X7U7K1_BRACI|nr:hypothetical protein Bca52824_063775 [Brassica carinata]
MFGCEVGESEAMKATLIGPMIPSAYLDGRIKDDKGYGSSLMKPRRSVWSGSGLSRVVCEAHIAKLPEGFVEATRDRALLVSWCNQLEWSDQMNDAKFVEEVWRVGYRAKEEAGEGVVKSVEVVRCLKGVMEGESSVEIRESSKKWKDLAVKAMREEALIGALANPISAPYLVRGLPALSYDELPSFVGRHWLSHAEHGRVLLNQFRNHEDADWLFVNGFEGLETQGCEVGESEAMKATLIGPMIPSAYLDGRIKDDKGYGSSLMKPLSEECMEWLGTKPSQSVVFVSFGSFGILFEKQLAEVATALRESNFNFLWVIKEAHIAKLPEGFVEATRDRALLVSWCNQLEVLAHESIGCFLTHCGWNSTLEGLSLGVPMVGVPQWSDQMNDAKFVEEVWRVGYRAKEEAGEGVVKSVEVVRCLKGVMEGESSVEIRESSKKWKDLAVKAMSEGGSCGRSSDLFVGDDLDEGLVEIRACFAVVIR